MDNPLFH